MKIVFVQKFIDKLRKKSIHPYMTQLSTKVLSFEEVKDNIDTLILGSSHGQLGYRAKDNEYNFALSFQDLYNSWILADKYLNPKIKNVILFYSVFSAGHQMIKTKLAEITSIYKAVTGADYQDKELAKEKGLYSLEADFVKQYKKIKKNFKKDLTYRGNEIAYVTAVKADKASDRAEPHLKNNQRGNNQTQYVEKIYNLAKKHNAKMLVVIPPATQAYKDCLPSSSTLWRELTNLQNKLNFEIIDMYDSDIFKDDDFKDYDHLNLNGAIKLTEIINNKMVG